MTRADIAQQLVLVIGGPDPEALLRDVLARLAPWTPEVVAAWSLVGDEPNPDVLVRLVQCSPEMPEPEVITGLNAERDVLVEPNMVMTRASSPNDPRYGEQWALGRMSAEAAWDCAIEAGPAHPVTVAVIDSGVARSHPELSARVDPLSAGFADGPAGNSAEDEDGHGTFLAGTIGAIANNLTGIAGVTGPVAVKLLALKFYNPWTPLTSAFAAQAIAYAVRHGARVINASWHVGMNSKVLFRHVQLAARRNVLFVAAAGNEGTNNDELPIWPASYVLPNVVSVMASARPPVMLIDGFDDKPGFSNYGPTTVHVAAPGVGVLSTHYYLAAQPPQYREYGGTSAAAAHVSAAAGLIRALRPGWSAAQVRAHLVASVDPSPYLKCIARGRLSLQRAICTLS